MDELLEQFLIEGRELVAQAAADFETLMREPGDVAAIDSAFRAIHTLKGSVGIFPLGPAGRVLHAAEDVLERARNASGSLDAGIVAGLVACLDAVHRWIDEIEQIGTVSVAAESIATDAIARLSGKAAVAPRDAAGEAPDWVAGLAAREAETIRLAEGSLTAFRYTPDTNCFFRGEDPLAIVTGLPDLIALAVLPAEGAWPALNHVEPFACISILEGLSAGPPDVIRTAFRLMPDQVALHRVEPTVEALQETLASGGRAAATFRVDAARIDALADRLGELVVAANAFAPLAEQADAVDRSLATSIRAIQANIDRVVADLHRSVSAVRLVPLAPALRRLPRMAREIAEGLGKQIEFVITGEGIEVDKQIADGLFEPLLHLIRNAMDHGVEAPEIRSARGKRAQGRVSLNARRDGNAILVTLEDDGTGIEPDRIRTIAVSRGLIGVDAAAQLSDAALLRLMFTPGFSTASEVTEVSGRGVGMDAVRAAVEGMRGTVDITSMPGEGTRFSMSIPANALTTRLLVIQVGQDRYGIAPDQIVESIRIDSDKLVPIGGGSACVLRGRTVPVLSLATLLGGDDTPGATAKLLVTQSGGKPVAFKVDGFAERIDSRIRPSSGILASVPGVTGSTLLGDGGVLLILDLQALAA